MANELEIKSTYSAKGLVVGRCWGGGLAGYPTVKYEGYSSVENLLNLVRVQLRENRGIDSGMGFEKLVGVALHITETMSTMIGEKEFLHETEHDVEILTLPGLDEPEKDAIQDIIDDYLFNY